MAREVDPKRVRKALARVRRLVAAAADAPPERALSEWEAEFAQSLETRLLAYGSAFADPEKGALDQPLSHRQGRKLKEIAAKTRGAAPDRAVADGDGEPGGPARRTPHADPRRRSRLSDGRSRGAGPRVRHVEAD